MTPETHKTLGHRTLLSPLRHHSGGGHHNWSGDDDQPDADMVLHDLSHWVVKDDDRAQEKTQNDPQQGPKLTPSSPTSQDDFMRQMGMVASQQHRQQQCRLWDEILYYYFSFFTCRVSEQV